MPFFSIQLNSNRPKQIGVFFDSIEATADAPQDIEVLLHIDDGDSAMEEAVEREREKRRFALRVLKTSLVQGYGTLWKPLNSLFAITDPEAYFLMNVSDEFLFETKGWDSIVRRYEGYYPDHIFRLRASQYRFRNYTDLWECGFAPDSLAFYTRQWLTLCGEWCPCLGPDSFQQCVAFYMATSDPFLNQQFNRDIPLAELRFSGEGISIGLSGQARWQRVCENIRAWSLLMSHEIQQRAKRCAMKLKAHARMASLGTEAEVVEDTNAAHFVVRDTQSKKAIETYNYRLSYLRTTLTNLMRTPMLLHYNGSRRPAGRHPVRNLAFTMLTSCALYLALWLPSKVAGKLLASAESWWRKYRSRRT